MDKLEKYAAQESKEKDHKMTKAEILSAFRAGSKKKPKK
jgi:hypothetical protein